MTTNRLYRFIPYVKGKTSKQAHVDLPKTGKEMTTYEEEHGRQGFFGKVSHLYHINPPTGFTKIDGDFKPTLINTNSLNPTDKEDPWGSPVTFLRNEDVQLKVSRRSSTMPFYFKNTEGDDVWFVHRGNGTVQSLYGVMNFNQGDYIIFPRGTPYKIIPKTQNNFFLIIESKEEIQIPDRGLLGPTALFDPALIEVPEPNPLENGGKGQESIVRFKNQDKYTDYTFDFDIGRNVVGWKGDVTPWKLNIDNFLPLNSHRYHLPPSAHTTLLSQGFVVCSFVPRPFETAKTAIKVPFYHSNVEYDEVIFYHAGDFFSRDNIDHGMVTLHPAGFTHGPHPKALKNLFKQDKLMTDEYAVMVDTKNPLKVTPEGRNAVDPAYIKSWMDS